MLDYYKHEKEGHQLNMALNSQINKYNECDDNDAQLRSFKIVT